MDDEAGWVALGRVTSGLDSFVRSKSFFAFGFGCGRPLDDLRFSALDFAVVHCSVFAVCCFAWAASGLS